MMFVLTHTYDVCADNFLADLTTVSVVLGTEHGPVLQNERKKELEFLPLAATRHNALLVPSLAPWFTWMCLSLAPDFKSNPDLLGELRSYGKPKNEIPVAFSVDDKMSSALRIYVEIEAFMKSTHSDKEGPLQHLHGSSLANITCDFIETMAHFSTPNGENGFYMAGSLLATTEQSVTMES
ncbi:Nacht, Lrr And Pyd Domains-Containing Protein 1 [Manis pentadactyla]|nr:Nacht, Lrr And Pyd Domains-Containing Protein 1 [Manis pentadactyla]